MPEFVLSIGDTGNAHARWLDLDHFTRGYIEAMFFTNSGDRDDELPKDASFDDLAPATLESIKADCAAFQAANEALLERAIESGGKYAPDYDEQAAGRDFWFTRCGHGVGYWDRGFAEDLGDALSDAADKFGEVWVTLGDDGKIYL